MIQSRSDWKNIDSSKLTDYLRCPRYYFYRHILGWEFEGKNINLIFGESWHRAKEHILVHGTEDESLADAMNKFMAYYRQYFTEHTDLGNYPKNPGNALQALIEYRKQYGSNSEYKVVTVNGKPATEIYGTVPVSGERIYHFRIDAIMQNVRNGKYLYDDHKTSGSDRPIYQKTYQLSMQMLAYYHVINCLYPPEEVEGGMVELTIFRKKGNLHIRVPIRKTLAMMDEWLHNVNRFMEDIELDIRMLREVDNPDKSMMKSFKKNDQGCCAYNMLCKYFDFCTAWSNPLKRADSPPDGFVVDIWDPGKREELMEVKV